jgi:deazaflavin-dependent oxidoreductase (nitroreductase family)
MADPHQPVAQRRSASLGHRLFLAVTWIFKGLLRLGVPLGPMVLLTVRGRKSGQLRTTPVDLFEGNGHSFLVSTHRQDSSNWVRNLRAAREGEIRRGHKHWMFTAQELPPEIAGKVLKEVLAPRLALPVRGFVLRRTFPVSPEAPQSEFAAAAQDHPVFEIIPPRAA